MSSTTVKYKARRGDTVESIATVSGVRVDEIIALNNQLNPTSKLVANEIYLLPRNASHNSFSSVNDIIVEWNARKTEARQGGQ